MTVDELNGLDQGAFVARLDFLFEGAGWVAAEAWRARPLSSVDQLHRELVGAVLDAPLERQVALIEAHPDLAGKAALAGDVTAESRTEQSAAGLDRLSRAELDRFTALNRAYRERFGFPFVACVRDHSKESILASFEERMGHSRGEEVGTALAEIARITRLRLDDAFRVPRYSVSYGKHGVAVYRAYARPLAGIAPIPESDFVQRGNELLAVEVDVDVFGDNFLAAYTEGDNSSVVATDSMKNFVLDQSLRYGGATLEGLLDFIARGFLDSYPQMAALRLSGRELGFAAARVPAQGCSDRLFARSRSGQAVAVLDFDRDAGGARLTDHRCGCVELELLKVTGSSFTHFHRDEHTTLPERGDRPLHLTLDVHWRYRDPAPVLGGGEAGYVPAEQVRDLVHVVFHEFVSESIQHLVHAMGERLLASFGQLAEVSFHARNLTPDPVATSEQDPRQKVYSAPFPAVGVINLTTTAQA